MVRLLQIFFIILLSFTLKAQIPTAIIIVPSTSICSGSPYTFTTSTTNTPTVFSWSIIPSTSVTIFPDKTSDFINLSFAKGGVYTLSLQIANATGTNTAVKIFTVEQTAHAAFNASLTGTGFPNQLVLTNYSTYNINNLWIYSDDVTTNTLVSTVKNYTVSGSYSVMLIAFGNKGCNDTSRYSLRISDSSGITLPNIFTPNDDGVNDVFKPVAKGISDMKVWIYSRYGTFIHSWDKPNGSWDGYTTSGEPCQAGTYFCVIEATGFDGKSYKLKGNITLLK
jgi:gliding motility-associated-like protein